MGIAAVAFRPCAPLPDADVDGLRGRWRDLCSRAGFRGPIEAVFDRVVDAYGEPHRRYHALGHVAAVLAVLDALCAPDAVPVAVELAAWFHDVVYDTAPAATAEADSAEWAAGALASLDAAGPLITDVGDLILVTAGHEASTPAARLLVDADLWILGAPRDVYDRYVAGVRAEYGHVSDDAWRLGRPRILRALLSRAPLFHDGRLAAQDEQARRNVDREVAALEAR